jgi:hypothetical protein
MNRQPAYFETIRQKAARRWDQLEQDPELAGPWHQLFKQVQSPRHILSELLQNADDAGATEASVSIQGDVFIFEHNGEDFSEEHFGSLCRFGYSNKRALHTIGFRGIGFKSTFSLGDCVDLFTPSLAVRFHRDRFTEPLWLSEPSDTCGRTRVRVDIKDRHRRSEIDKNIEEWPKSPISLLFFRNIRRMRIGDQDVHWGSLGPGPIPDSEWMALYGKEDDAFLLVRSAAEAFPEEALTEIRQERMLGGEEESEFPPCKVEIVLGAKGRLYVVLPTGVETELPFACNAPFIQDPARLKIKDPDTSPTNRWLLERAGRLAAEAMLRWLGQSEMSLVERARAYGLLPDVDREDSSLEGECGTTVEEAFSEAIDGQSVLLTEDGQLASQKEGIIIPKLVLDVWSAQQAVAFLDEKDRPALCQHVDDPDRKKLLRWGLVEEIDKQTLLRILQSKHLPKPETWRQLMLLWAYVAPEITGYRHYVNPKDVRIVPVQGKDVLYAASEVVRLGEKKLLQSEADWEFLAAHLVVLNQNWPRFLAEQRRSDQEQSNAPAGVTIRAAYAVLEEIGLDDTSDASKLIDQVAGEFFSKQGVTVQRCVQLAQIAAKLGASAGAAFRFATRDLRLRSVDQIILFGQDSKLEEMLPPQQRDAQLLHPDYAASFGSCSSEEWLKWVTSGRAGLHTFIPLVQKRETVYGKRRIEQEARKRGLQGDLFHHYVTEKFVIEDWDFDEQYWRHWKVLAIEDDRFWLKIVDHILAQRDAFWTPAKTARLLQVATTGKERSMTFGPLLPSWVLRFRDLPCLPDVRGFARKPGDLLRRTPETEPLMDVELFVHSLLDRDTTRPLLDLLGVRSMPTGPERILDCLRALSKAEKPPVHEVEKWYRRLDQMVETCSTTDFQKIKQAFRSEKLVLTQDGAWAATPAIFLSSDEEDVPDAAIVRSSVADLTFWRKIGVAERPTADLAIDWLKALPSSQALPPEDVRRVRALLVRYPVRIWEECGHWLSLSGEWTSCEGLSYALTMQSLIPWGHLHQWVKQKTADLQRLPAEVTNNPPFAGLPALAGHVEERLHRDLLSAGQAEKKEWLATLGAELRRIELDRQEDTQHVRILAEVLAQTGWRTAHGLEIIPYIDGTPAGTPRKADVLWLDRVLYVDRLPKAKLARRVPEEIGKAFGRADIKAALDYSFERSPADVRDYLEENFNLVALTSLPEEASDSINESTAEAPNASSPDPEVYSPDQAATLNGSGDASTHTDATDVGEGEAPPDEPDEEAPATMDGLEQPEPRPRPAPKPAKPSLIERFAKAQGFCKDSDDRFFHEDGSWIGRAAGSPFPWERRSRTGELVRSYLPLNGCIEREPVEIKAEVWDLLKQRPDVFALIATRIDDSPIELTGAALTEMRRAGKVTLYPATYRLVHEENH